MEFQWNGFDQGRYVRGTVAVGDRDQRWTTRRVRVRFIDGTRFETSQSNGWVDFQSRRRRRRARAGDRRRRFAIERERRERNSLTAQEPCDRVRGGVHAFDHDRIGDAFGHFGDGDLHGRAPSGLIGLDELEDDDEDDRAHVEDEHADGDVDECEVLGMIFGLGDTDDGNAGQNEIEDAENVDRPLTNDDLH